MPNKHISRNIFRTASGCERSNPWKSSVREPKNPMSIEARAKNEPARVMLDEEQRRTIMSILLYIMHVFCRGPSGAIPIYFNFIVSSVLEQFSQSHVGFSGSGLGVYCNLSPTLVAEGFCSFPLCERL
jgi:hypothetical protein